MTTTPIAPQIKNCSTYADFKKFTADAANGARHEADEFMRRGDSKWVARSLAEGWGDILRGLVAELCRRHMLKHGTFPTAEHLSHLTINSDDHAAYKRLRARA